MKLSDLDEALAELDMLEACAAPKPKRGWSIYKVLMHCAQSIDASLDGYPTHKPALIRKTIGRLVARRFLSKGELSHDIESPIPGAPDIPADGDVSAAIGALRASIQRFRKHDGKLKPHFVFDDLDKTSYERMHAMHIADHLSSIDYRD